MADLLSEELITLAAAAKLLPPGRKSRPVHVSSLLRGIQRGVRGHKLEAVRSGSRWLTSEPAVRRWLEAQTRAALGGDAATAPPEPRSPVGRRRASERAERELIAAGA